MGKRDHARINGPTEAHRSRTKRRRESAETASEGDVSMSDLVSDEYDDVEENTLLQQHALKMWQTVKDTVKDGRSISIAFLKKPSKKQYPDYYNFIKQPIALDDIKKRIEAGTYETLEDVKNDFELCFNNAKEYNMQDSPIWLDAKELMKVTHKTYKQLAPAEEDKQPSLHRMLKERLEKLVAKTDEHGRVLSDIFMELPSKEEWPSYYYMIKEPQCFGNIFKRLKRKEYPSATEFAADVELVFRNAMTFNEDHSMVWEDAVTLREVFRNLLSDLPAPYAISQYAKPVNKIKIRPMQAQPTASTSSATTKSEPAPSITLRVPAQSSAPKPTPQPAKPSANELPSTSKLPPAPVSSKASTAKPSAPKPALPPKASVAKAVIPKPTAGKPSTALPSTAKPVVPKAASATPKPVAPKPPVQLAPAQPKVATPQPAPPVQNISFVHTATSHYPNATYTAPPAPTPTPVLKSGSAANAQGLSQSPAPVILPLNHQLKHVDVRIQPQGRILDLDHRDGVKSWAMRLLSGETTLVISNVTFMSDEEDEESEDDEKEEDDDGDMEVDIDGDASLSPSKNGRGRPKRRRGRPPKAATLAARAAAAASKAKSGKKGKGTAKIGELQLKLNNVVVKDQAGEWSVIIPVGSNTIEIGETGGMIWKVYVERQA